PEMISKIKVLDSTYFAIVGADGAFRIEQVPVGSYPLVAWQANGSEARSQVTVTAAGKTQIDLTLTQGRAELRHTRKDGTPYGRYK
ncbi:MAG TPA: carboxypeptidase-like regulatory domain-containing protein, partial [Pseudomonadota bacterium]|nr:carboxypeptidase-like regulatory domain-containing protein [Pseudomonadota bacterium]